MKATKILMAGIAAFAFTHIASADTVLNLTGSTAFRGQTHTSIINALGAAATTYAYTGTSGLSKAGQAIFIKGTSPNKITVRTSWSGSDAGVQTVAGGLNVNFLPVTTPTSAGGTANATAGTDAAVPDVAMVDNYQGSSRFNGGSFATLVDNLVGVVPFKWIASPGAPFSNITPGLAQVLWSNGTIAMALFTGNLADEGTTIYATGRDPDSGTRTITFAESGIGVFSPCVQYQPTLSGTTITALNPWPTIVVNGITFTTGNGGYNSGALVATAMSATAPAGSYLVSYASTGDAGTAITAGAVELKWNGVLYSANAVIEGQYTFWGYEHLMYKSTLSGVKLSTATAIGNDILTVTSVPLIGSMHVARTADGGNITQNY